MTRISIPPRLSRWILPHGRWGRVRAGALAACLGLLVLHVGCLPRAALGGYEPQEGDLVFQSLYPVPIVRAIEGATHSDYSHCGIVLKDGAGNWIVREAFSIHGVDDTPVREFAARGRLAAVDIYRLAEAPAGLGPRLRAASEPWLGLPYDFLFKPGDDEFYCSELVWKAYHEIGLDLGEWRTLGSLDWQPYERTIRRLEGGEPPLGRSMITPRAVAESARLVKVHAWGGLQAAKP